MVNDDSEPLTRDLAPFGLRMPPGLKERVRAAAAKSKRSMNAEIVATLEREYPEVKMTLDDFMDYLVGLRLEAKDNPELLALVEKAEQKAVEAMSEASALHGMVYADRPPSDDQ